ncbi:type IX secretion system protein PorG [Gynurincola endophyticus]|uniref:type IX secretion system protein PorG n=1 Tax=Gynurincola endophyticus TaxID=2479004 RepID=UPI000F8D9A5B|nr:DUF6089 family protein [Gynurincola endophyticus]
MFNSRIICIVLILMAGISFEVKAQYEAYQQEGEIGIGVGAAHYFGDLNTRGRINRLKPAATIFFRKQINNYIAGRLQFGFAQLGYSDQYNTHNEYMQRRNLSFNSNVYELSIQGDFNFFKFNPVDPGLRFTPYVTLGVGAFYYDPYAYYQGEKYFLRPLNTEGQGTSLYPDRKPYKSIAMMIPFGVGVKYALNDRLNIGFEVVHRFTNTDYLDDVSTTYAGPAAFPPVNGQPSIAYILQDRSGDLGIPIGLKDAQRGFSKQKDQYMMALLTLSFNFNSYNCPKY